MSVDWPETCRTCGNTYSKNGLTVCSSSFHCCRDCTWHQGRVIEPCADHKARFDRKRALSFLKKRYATCGACGCEKEVTLLMQTSRQPDYQFKARPDQETDSYYCGCQGDADDCYGGTWWDPW